MATYASASGSTGVEDSTSATGAGFFRKDRNPIPQPLAQKADIASVDAQYISPRSCVPRAPAGVAVELVTNANGQARIAAARTDRSAVGHARLGSALRTSRNISKALDYATALTRFFSFDHRIHGLPPFPRSLSRSNILDILSEIWSSERESMANWPMPKVRARAPELYCFLVICFAMATLLANWP